MYYNQRHTNVGWFQDKNLQLCSKRKERKQKKNSSRWYMYMLLIFLSSWDGRVLNRKSWRTIGKRAWVWQELALVTPVVINSIYAGMLRHGLKAAEMRKRHNNKRGKKKGDFTICDEYFIVFTKSISFVAAHWLKSQGTFQENKRLFKREDALSCVAAAQSDKSPSLYRILL